MFAPGALRQKRRQLPPVEPSPLAGPTPALHCDLEDALGQVDRDRRRILDGLLLFGFASTR